MTLWQLAIILIVAVLAAAATVNRRFRVPVVVAELIVGIALGHSGFQALDPSAPEFSFLAQIGFALIMFVAGTHVPVRERALIRGLRVGAIRAMIVAAASVPVAFGVAALFGTGHGLLYAVLLFSSSAALLMPLLQGVPLTGTTLIEFLPQVAIADTLSIVLVPLVVEPDKAGPRALGALIVLAGAALLFFIYRALDHTGWRRKVHEVSARRNLALELRTVLAGLFLLSALAVAVHVSVMLAGFSLGLAIAAVKQPRRLERQLFGLTEGFFGPVFFVWVGASLDLRAVWSHPSTLVLGAALGLAAVIVRLPLIATGMSKSAALASCAQIGVPIAVVAAASEAGTLGPGEGVSILIGALITIVVVSVASRPLVIRARVEAAHDRPLPSTS